PLSPATRPTPWFSSSPLAPSAQDRLAGGVPGDTAEPVITGNGLRYPALVLQHVRDDAVADIEVEHGARREGTDGAANGIAKGIADQVVPVTSSEHLGQPVPRATRLEG